MFDPSTTEPEQTDNAVYCVFHGNHLVTDLNAPEPCLLPRDQVRFLAPEPVRQVFLGFWKGRPVYARELDHGTSLDAPHYQTGTLYQILGRVPDSLFALAGRAQQLLHWDRDNRYCGRCGGEMSSHTQERAMNCSPCEIMV